MPERSVASSGAGRQRRSRELTRGLRAEPGDATLEMVVEGDNRPVLRFVPAAGRVRVELMLLGVKAADMTARPGAVVELLRAEAGIAERDANGWFGAVESAVSRWAAGHGIGSGHADRRDAADRLVGLLGGLGFPVVRELYSAGIEPLREVPHWAVAALAAADPPGAAHAAFGAKATRPVTAALLESLRPPPAAGLDATLALGPLARALVGVEVLEPDHLRGLLQQREPWQPPHRWPTLDALTRGRRAVRLLGPERTRRLLNDPAATANLTELFGTLTLAELTGPRLPVAAAGSLAALREACERLLTPHARPDPPAAAPRRRAATAALSPPPAPPAPPGTFVYPALIATAEGAVVDDLVLRLPAGPDQLRAWGVQLANCLGTFPGAVAAGRSWIIGIEQGQTLIGAAEISPDGRIRQLLGRSNRPLPAPLHASVEAELRALGIIT
jgi:hypothetical protein